MQTIIKGIQHVRSMRVGQTMKSGRHEPIRRRGFNAGLTSAIHDLDAYQVREWSVHTVQHPSARRLFD